MSESMKRNKTNKLEINGKSIGNQWEYMENCSTVVSGTTVPKSAVVLYPNQR